MVCICNMSSSLSRSQRWHDYTMSAVYFLPLSIYVSPEDAFPYPLLKKNNLFLDKGNKTLFYHYMALTWHYLCHQRFRLLCFWFHFYNSPHELANFLYPDHLNLVEYNFRIWYITKVLGVSESLVSLSLFEWLTV